MEIMMGVGAYLLIGFGWACFFKFFDWFFDDWDSQSAVMCVFLWPLFLAFAIIKLVTRPLYWLFEFMFD